MPLRGRAAVTFDETPLVPPRFADSAHPGRRVRPPFERRLPDVPNPNAVHGLVFGGFWYGLVAPVSALCSVTLMPFCSSFGYSILSKMLSGRR